MIGNISNHKDSMKPNYYPQEYTYKLIETLLPKANFKSGTNLRMLEIWGLKNIKRKGWIHLVEA